jgi:hypothetical protein
MALTTPARVARTVWLEAGTCHRPSCGREGRQRGRNKYENAGKSQSVLVVISSRSRTAHTRVTTDSPHASSQSMLCVCVCVCARACVQGAQGATLDALRGIHPPSPRPHLVLPPFHGIWPVRIPAEHRRHSRVKCFQCHRMSAAAGIGMRQPKVARVASDERCAGHPDTAQCPRRASPPRRTAVASARFVPVNARHRQMIITTCGDIHHSIPALSFEHQKFAPPPTPRGRLAPAYQHRLKQTLPTPARSPSGDQHARDTQTLMD